MNNTLDNYFDNLVQYGIATESEIKLVCNINGYSKESLNDILYSRTVYRTWNQYFESEIVDSF